MVEEEKKFLTNLCKLCVCEYQVVNNAPMIGALISQVCRLKELDVPLIDGILYIKIGKRKLQYAHCFNTYHGNIVDASIYQFAIMNKNIEKLFPKVVIGEGNEAIEYSVIKEIKYENQFKYKDEFLKEVLSKVDKYESLEIDKLDEYKDSKKQNLFYI
ncbi:hypothetical protein [Clostridium felsineum]|uniref:Uncharacterized protein n=1 Tax=Clostridium felsineum TaxID=36839 RepID=A0A1S8M7V0_9CLOT|nr:hypothetical protein [Clostridium felsineum]MCR3761086.1 hypothetical protein [Clostridium felsineum]URZ04009.1 hypothetical protein CLAUR_040750 [Clostridium felsineum]URZ07736.1 hypothetical protein CLROS_030970 [Clostridium felsineum]URZ12767.1 hypothetical protein CROST_035120 [Clostridium felsineum]URZ15268.1 hypothetical protein CLFE_012860 [Clostridium felsineum DSM 794]